MPAAANSSCVPFVDLCRCQGCLRHATGHGLSTGRLRLPGGDVSVWHHSAWPAVHLAAFLPPWFFPIAGPWHSVSRKERRMCQDAKTSSVQTYIVRLAPYYGHQLDPVRIDAQGFRREDGRVLFWRRLPDSAEQVVAELNESSVMDVFEDADMKSDEMVPTEWVTAYGAAKRLGSAPSGPRDGVSL